MKRDRPWLVYDADCGFCTRSAEWVARDGGPFQIVAWQAIPSLEALELTLEDVTTAAYWITPDGRQHRGADAIGMALLARGSVASLFGRVILFPTVRPLARLVYLGIARNRHRMPGGTAACRIERPPPS